MQLSMSAAITARWGHRVDGLIHTHAWTVEATVTGAPDAAKVMPADDLEAILTDAVSPWVGRYLTDTDEGEWKGYEPLCCEREPTVEELVRMLWAELEPRVDGLLEVSLVESHEFDRCRRVSLRRT